ncbi:3-deoxy-D-manno-octulosonic acid transferase [Pelagibius sp.]|uniref:3-deoxy-D-manno-octulosonic acid transferase n=1 Tax=Pelagibius sp. TaxID=1931238 RepID=UPI0026051D78|nr:3-deoxy-D-manno-octulosonic acid transferase [Pelagibius sp.]
MAERRDARSASGPGEGKGSGRTLGAFGARAIYGSYALLGTLAAPLVRGLLRRRVARGREDPLRVGERLGAPGLARPEGPLVWLHAASVGEAVSLLPLIERLRAERPALNLLMTSGTVTSAKLMRERLPAGVIHQFVPVDLPAAVDRFLDHWRPALGLMVESEFWPNLIRRSAAAGTELVLLNGRVSPASHRSWRRARPLIAELLRCFSLIMARSPRDLAHLQDLGAEEAFCPGDLKAAAPALSADPASLADLRAAIGGRPVWLAASTHEGEEEVAGTIHKALSDRHAGLLTLLVPRHPNRAAAVRSALEAKGLSVAQRSRDEAIAASTEIYLADTMGEMGLWLRLAAVVFLGGSLVPTGGHNLLEPAKLGCAVLTGPHTTNFSLLAEDMLAAGALRRVADAAQLEAAVERLLEDSAARQALAAAAGRYAGAQAGVLDRVVAALAPVLDRAAARH